MASAVAQDPVETFPPTADIVGNAFVHQYYHILHQSPKLVHRFYQDISKLGRPEENGIMSITTTMQAINEKILSLDYGELRAEIITVDSQESLSGGVLVLVTGYLIGKDNLRHKFSQSFFLAPQEKGYFVLNDVFRYIDDPTYQNADQCTINGDDASLTSENDNDGEEVHSFVVDEKEDKPVPEVDEIKDDQHTVADSNPKIEEVLKKSYASIVKVMKENVMPISSSNPAHPTSIPKSQEQQAAAIPSFPVAEPPNSSSNANENESIPESEGNGHSIYVKGLPMSATLELLENEFKKFGRIKNDGVQVRSQKGFCFGFVEFDLASSMHSAIEASPVIINGCPVVVEEKRSTNRGNNRGRFSSGRGVAYRNEVARGRGGYYVGGRGYGRNDFNGRTEFGNKNGNRGGFPRGGDGYHRAEHMGSNAGHGSRTNGLTTTQRVAAPA